MGYFIVWVLVASVCALIGIRIGRAIGILFFKVLFGLIGFIGGSVALWLFYKNGMIF